MASCCVDILFSINLKLDSAVDAYRDARDFIVFFVFGEAFSRIIDTFSKLFFNFIFLVFYFSSM